MEKETKQIIIYVSGWILLNLLVYFIIDPTGTIITNILGFVGVTLGLPSKIKI